MTQGFGEEVLLRFRADLSCWLCRCFAFSCLLMLWLILRVSMLLKYCLLAHGLSWFSLSFESAFEQGSQWSTGFCLESSLGLRLAVEDSSSVFCEFILLASGEEVLLWDTVSLALGLSLSSFCFTPLQLPFRLLSKERRRLRCLNHSIMMNWVCLMPFTPSSSFTCLEFSSSLGLEFEGTVDERKIHLRHHLCKWALHTMASSHPILLVREMFFASSSWRSAFGQILYWGYVWARETPWCWRCLWHFQCSFCQAKFVCQDAQGLLVVWLYTASSVIPPIFSASLLLAHALLLLAASSSHLVRIPLGALFPAFVLPQLYSAIEYVSSSTSFSCVWHSDWLFVRHLWKCFEIDHQLGLASLAAGFMTLLYYAYRFLCWLYW